MRIEKKSFGVIPETVKGKACKYAGTEIFNYRLIADNGMNVEISELGAVIKEINVADFEGNYDNILLSYDTLEDFLDNVPCFGAPIGRVANRTAGAEFTLCGEKFTLLKNDGENNLHSGIPDNYFMRPYKTVECSFDEKEAIVGFYLFSPDKDQGYPGDLDLYITYRLDNEGRLTVSYKAKSSRDTLFNMTNHSYFNLGGNMSGNTLSSYVFIDADRITEADSANIPTGRFLDVTGTPFDFRNEKQIKQDIDKVHPMLVKGYDCNFVLNNNKELKKVASLRHESNGRMMEIFTDLPGMQFYSGNYIDKMGSRGVHYKDFDGVCLETHIFPDAIHHDNFPTAVIKAGEEYTSTTIYKFSV